jgi:hypothetical protein
MNWAAAALVGVAPGNPRLHRTADLQGVTGEAPSWTISGVAVTVGTTTLVDTPIRIFADGSDAPRFTLGRDHVRDRAVFVSYSTGQLCLGAHVAVS